MKLAGASLTRATGRKLECWPDSVKALGLVMNVVNAPDVPRDRRGNNRPIQATKSNLSSIVSALPSCRRRPFVLDRDVARKEKERIHQEIGSTVVFLGIHIPILSLTRGEEE